VGPEVRGRGAERYRFPTNSGKFSIEQIMDAKNFNFGPKISEINF